MPHWRLRVAVGTGGGEETVRDDGREGCEQMDWEKRTERGVPVVRTTFHPWGMSYHLFIDADRPFCQMETASGTLPGWSTNWVYYICQD